MPDPLDYLAQSIRNLDARLRELANSEPKARAWTNFTLSGSWTNVAAGTYGPASYYAGPGKRVHLGGRVSGGAVGTTIATLPVGYRPQYSCSFYVPGGSQVSVNTDGTIVLSAGATDVSLWGISFRAYS